MLHGDKEEIAQFPPEIVIELYDDDAVVNSIFFSLKSWAFAFYCKHESKAESLNRFKMDQLAE